MPLTFRHGAATQLGERRSEVFGLSQEDVQKQMQNESEEATI